MPSRLKLVALAAALALPGLAAAQTVTPLGSTPQTVIRGEINNTRTPVLRVKSGQTVRIDTVSHAGATEEAVSFFGGAGIAPDGVLKDVIDIGKMPRPEGFGGHVLTGPIYVEGAEPGDLLEVKIIEVKPRVPYGVNTPGPGGVAPTLVKERTPKIIKFDLARKVALFAPGVEVPLKPFMGIMAVAPDPATTGGKVGSKAPGRFGGNMDVNRLTDGSTLYLPVMNPGALFYTGDSHAVQGDGEVDGTAIEASMTATLQFVLHKGAGTPLAFPVAEDKDNFYIMGMNEDLDLALKSAVEQTVAFLQRRAKLSASDAYSLASVGIDFSIGEAVDVNLLVYGIVPKKLFKTPVSVN
ncbi:MAG: acetamidase/formamidase family protein [Caulobacterales bacterium]|nr:acetamidase/formamidase family protein [Caulobacterales bacterium]